MGASSKVPLDLKGPPNEARLDDTSTLERNLFSIIAHIILDINCVSFKNHVNSTTPIDTFLPRDENGFCINVDGGAFNHVMAFPGNHGTASCSQFDIMDIDTTLSPSGTDPLLAIFLNPNCPHRWQIPALLKVAARLLVTTVPT